MTPGSCPDPVTLAALLDDTLSSTQQERLADHIERCPACRARLDEMTIPAQLQVTGESAMARARGVLDIQPSREMIERWLRAVGPYETSLSVTSSAPEWLAWLEAARAEGEIGWIGPYRVERCLGHGGMGVVLLATDPGLRRQVAIKLPLPQLLASSEARGRFLREARSVAAVLHDNVVAIHTIDDAGDRPYLVMEYVPGQSLQHRLDTAGPLPSTVVARIGAEVAEALAAAHACGVMHRDVKPANILLDERNGRAKLGDFGLARSEDDPALTQIGIVAGTPEYIAPEVAHGSSIDFRADLYSLGATLYAAATGRPPLTATSTQGLLRKLGRETPPTVRSLSPLISPGLARVIERLLETDRERRPQTATEAAASLRGLVEERRPTRRTSLAGIVAVAVACTGLVAAWNGWQGRSMERPSSTTTSALPVIAPAAPSGPILLDATRGFANLGEAIEAAVSGSVIEIKEDGPHAIDPLHLGRKKLTIRAAPGVEPLIELTRGDESATDPVLTTDEALTLEGLRFRSRGARNAQPGADPSGFAMIVVRGGPFRAAHCRFEVGAWSACLALVRSQGELLGCQFLGKGSLGISWAPRSDHVLRIRKSQIVCYNGLVIDLDRSAEERCEPALALDHVTLRCTSALRVHGSGARLAPSLPGLPNPFVRIETKDCVFDVANLLVVMNTSSAGRVADNRPSAAVSRHLRSRFEWLGEGNLYPLSPAWLVFASRGQAGRVSRAGPQSLEEWGRFWGRPEKDSIVRALRFSGTIDADDPLGQELVPVADSGSPEQNGADPTRCGPGLAYDAWRSSPESEAWNQAR